MKHTLKEKLFPKDLTMPTEYGEPVDEEGGRQNTRKDVSITGSSTILEKANIALAVGVVGSAVAAMLVVNETIVIISSLLSCLVGPYTAFQQTQLTDMIALGAAHEKVQREVDILMEQNARLKETEDEIRTTVDRLGDVEEALHVITNTHGESIKEFAAQVQENGEILEQMKTNLKQSALQNLLSVITRSDTNNDEHIDENETEDLIGRIKSINMIELDQNHFRVAIRDSGGSLRSVIKIVKNLLEGNDNPNNERERKSLFTLSM